jgi:hypothetical protein
MCISNDHKLCKVAITKFPFIVFYFYFKMGASPGRVGIELHNAD